MLDRAGKELGLVLGDNGYDDSDVCQNGERRSVVSSKSLECRGRVEVAKTQRGDTPYPRRIRGGARTTAVRECIRVTTI